MIHVDVIPDEGKKKVTLVFESDDEETIGVHELVKCMAHYIKHLIDEHGIDFKEVAISKNDTVTKKVF